jgi:hypothetical protein
MSEQPEKIGNPPNEDAWAAFELDEETTEPEPEYGDFWSELDDNEQMY